LLLWPGKKRDTLVFLYGQPPVCDGLHLNDLDRIAIHDDDPMIPEEQKNAPVLKLLNKRRPRRRR
jgi:hypothetical protein